MKKFILFISLIFIFICFDQSSLWANPAKKQRIVSLAPSVTEILFCLGLEGEIVAVTTFCDYPPKAQNIEKVGTFSQPSIEKIISIEPDIIFATSLEQASVVHKLRQLGMNVCVSDPLSFEGLFSSINEIAKLTYKEQEAGVLIDEMKSRIMLIKDKVKSIPRNERPKVFVEIWDDPLTTAGEGSFVDELIGLAGGVNIAYDASRAYSYFSTEQVLSRNPDCIILGYMNNTEAKIRVKDRLGWKNITAVKNNRIYNDINSDLFLRPGPRLVKGLEEIYKRLHLQ